MYHANGSNANEFYENTCPLKDVDSARCSV